MIGVEHNHYYSNSKKNSTEADTFFRAKETIILTEEEKKALLQESLPIFDKETSPTIAVGSLGMNFALETQMIPEMIQSQINEIDRVINEQHLDILQNVDDEEHKFKIAYLELRNRLINEYIHIHSSKLSEFFQRKKIANEEVTMESVRHFEYSIEYPTYDEVVTGLSATGKGAYCLQKILLWENDPHIKQLEQLIHRRFKVVYNPWVFAIRTAYFQGKIHHLTGEMNEQEHEITSKIHYQARLEALGGNPGVCINEMPNPTVLPPRRRTLGGDLLRHLEGDHLRGKSNKGFLTLQKLTQERKALFAKKMRSAFVPSKEVTIKEYPHQYNRLAVTFLVRSGELASRVVERRARIAGSHSAEETKKIMEVDGIDAGFDTIRQSKTFLNQYFFGDKARLERFLAEYARKGVAPPAGVRRNDEEFVQHIEELRRRGEMVQLSHSSYVNVDREAVESLVSLQKEYYRDVVAERFGLDEETTVIIENPFRYFSDKEKTNDNHLVLAQHNIYLHLVPGLIDHILGYK